MHDALDDPRFIRALTRRDERAFTRLVLELQTPVYSVIFRLLGSREEARDVAQDVFVTVFRKIHLFRGDSKLSTWVLRVAANHAKNRIKYLARRQDRKQTSFEDLTAPPSTGRFNASFPRPDEVLEASRLQELLSAALARLDPHQREVVVLRDVQGLSYDDIADVTGLNIGTIKSRLHRGRAHLKAALERWTAGDELETSAESATSARSAKSATATAAPITSLPGRRNTG